MARTRSNSSWCSLLASVLLAVGSGGGCAFDAEDEEDGELDPDSAGEDEPDELDEILTISLGGCRVNAQSPVPYGSGRVQPRAWAICDPGKSVTMTIQLQRWSAYYHAWMDYGGILWTTASGTSGRTYYGVSYSRTAGRCYRSKVSLVTSTQRFFEYSSSVCF